MKFLYNFGLSQEDENTEAEALALPGGHVLSVASAGDMPLSLLAAGAESVAAVDVDAAQLHLARLKIAAVSRLEREEATRFLGLEPAGGAARQEWFRSVREALGASKDYWDVRRDYLSAGAIWAGRYERFVRRLARVVRPVFGRDWRRLCVLDNTGEQVRLFDRKLNSAVLRYALRIAFHPAVFAKRGMDPRSLKHANRNESAGDRYFSLFREFCTNTPADSNYLLHLHLLGRILTPAALPAYLTPGGYLFARSRLASLTLVHADMTSHLAASRPEYDRVHLSNLPDWLCERDFDTLLASLAANLCRNSRVIWRFLHVDRAVPRDLADKLILNRAWGESLRLRDRFPFYRIVPGSIAG